MGAPIIARPNVPWLPNPAPADPNVQACPTCGCQWFEEVEVKRYKEGFNLIISQKPISDGDVPFYFLRCLICGDIKELPIGEPQNGKIREMYDQLIKDLVKYQGDHKKV